MGKEDSQNNMHKLKIKKEFADAIVCGDKKFEVRKNDRGFQRGDLVCFDNVVNDGQWTHHPILGNVYEITYVLSGWGIKKGYVALALQQVEV